MAEHVGRDAHVGAAVEEAVDLLAPRRERHRAVEHRDAAGMEPVDLAGEREHRLAAERDDDRSRREPAELARADELERKLPLVDPELCLRERTPNERQRVERAEQPDVAVLAGEQQLRPRRAALLVVRPLHLVEHEHLARARRHLDRAAEDRRVLVDALLARDEPDALVAELRRQPPVRLLREHPERPCVDAAPPLREELERVVGLAGVRRPEVRDDRLRRRSPRRAAGSRSDPRRAARRRACTRRSRGRGARRARVVAEDVSVGFEPSGNRIRGRSSGVAATKSTPSGMPRRRRGSAARIRPADLASRASQTLR